MTPRPGVHTTRAQPDGRQSRLARLIVPQGDKLIQWAAYAILFAVMVFYILEENSQRGNTRFIITLLSLAGLLLVNIFWDEIRSRFASATAADWALLVTSIGLALLATWAGVHFSGLYLVLMISAQASIILQRLRASLALTAFLAGAYLAILGFQGLDLAGIVNVGLSMLTGLVFVITLSQVLQRYSEQTQRAEHLLVELQAANAELLAARQREKDLAVAEERVRMAREIHDGLGHHLTALSIQLQAAEKLITSDPQTAAQAVHTSRGEVQAALKEVRQSVAALRHTPVEGRNIPTTLSALVHEFEDRTGIHSTFRCTGEAGDLPPALAETLFRTVQEGLTNTQKHAPTARELCVDLAFEQARVDLQVENDGDNITQTDLEGGFGLIGISERVNQLGGRLIHGPLTGRGYRIAVSIPLAEAADDSRPDR